jgi:hypothetical protein
MSETMGKTERDWARHGYEIIRLLANGKVMARSDLERLSTEQARTHGVPHNETGGSFALTWLYKAKLVENARRGYWRLTDAGNQLLGMDEEEALKLVHRAYKTVDEQVYGPGRRTNNNSKGTRGSRGETTAFAGSKRFVMGRLVEQHDDGTATVDSEIHGRVTGRPVRCSIMCEVELPA